MLEVDIKDEYGYLHAMYACRLSRESTKEMDTIDNCLGEKDKNLAMRLLKADNLSSGSPHSVGLRFIIFYLTIDGPLFWWKQMDRYRVGVEKGSGSTMYNLVKRPLNYSDFSYPIMPSVLGDLNDHIAFGDFTYVNAMLPQSYMQKRAMMISLPAMRNIIKQRTGHKLTEWRDFIYQVTTQARYPELLLV